MATGSAGRREAQRLLQRFARPPAAPGILHHHNVVACADETGWDVHGARCMADWTSMSTFLSRPGAQDEQGVDMTLIDEMLRLSPEERLRLNDQTINAIQELRDAFATEQPDGPDHEAGRGGG